MTTYPCGIDGAGNPFITWFSKEAGIPCHEIRLLESNNTNSITKKSYFIYREKKKKRFSLGTCEEDES